MNEAAWFRDRSAWRLIGLRYLPALAALMLAWELAHAPLYTLWREAEPAYLAYAIVHCTLGDLLIGTFALLGALVVRREGPPARWGWRRLAALSAFFGAGYTAFSEWMNVTLLRSWTYAESMPTIDLGGFELGLTPLAQWLVVPPLALYLAARALPRSERAGTP